MRADTDGDRGQRFAAEPERRNPDEIGVRDDLGRCVALEGQPGVLARHAFPVVANEDARDAAAVHFDFDARRSRVQRVLDQLLDDRGRPFHHLAGRYPVDDLRPRDGGSWSRERVRHLENTTFPPTTVASTFVSTIWSGEPGKNVAGEDDEVGELAARDGALLLLLERGEAAAAVYALRASWGEMACSGTQPFGFFPSSVRRVVAA